MYVNKWIYVPKKYLSEKEIDTIKSDLTFNPSIVKYHDGSKLPPVYLFCETEDYLTLPKYYGKNKFPNYFNLASTEQPKKQTSINSFFSTLSSKSLILEPKKPLFSLTDLTPKGLDVNFGKFSGTLNSELSQPEAYNAMMKSLLTHKSAFLSLPPGGGKTVVALKIAADLGKKTLVVVHKNKLVQQWILRIQQYLPDIKDEIGILQQKKEDWQGKKIVITMVQSLLSRQYGTSTENNNNNNNNIKKHKKMKHSNNNFISNNPENYIKNDILDEFGCVIFDEAHRYNADHYSQALQMLSFQYMFALSGTPSRKDGKDIINYHWLGPVTFQTKKVYNHIPMVKIINTVKDFDIPKIPVCYLRKIAKDIPPKINRSKMITQLTELQERNDLIEKELIAKIDECFGPNNKDVPKKQILILSDRTKHLEYFLKKLKDRYKDTFIEFGLLIGSTSEEEREAVETCDVIFSTFAMFSEGIDIPTLCVLFMLTPISSLSQPVNRIIRGTGSPHIPFIYDFFDSYAPFVNSYRQRLNYFNKEKFIKLDSFGKPYHVIPSGKEEEDVDFYSDGDISDDEENIKKHKIDKIDNNNYNIKNQKSINKCPF